ncbi:ATP-binding protein [Pseudobdellovibrio sp. HCB154]|uniref:hybrid sensor histidine kinase/response regulator n=1 Tax=Pseudobdellovibrio sp. HCB154 TaxID=3386277 RepID=UPI003916DD04
MRPSTATGLLVLAFSFFLTSLKNRYRFLISLSALFCVVLGSFTLAGHFLPFPGLPASPQSALNFVLFGTSLLIYTFFTRFIRVAQILILLAGINAEIALTGYIFNATEFYGFPSYDRKIGMAVQTAVCFILSAVALVCSRPGVGMTQLLFREKSRSGAIARKLFLTIIFGPFVIGAITHFGLYLGLYRDRIHDALFVLIFITLIVRTTWQSAKQSEIEELRAEKALEEKQLFESFVENSLDFAAITGTDNLPKYLNPAGRHMVGLSTDYPIENASITDFYMPEDRSYAINVIKRSVNENGRWQGETTLRHWKSNKPIPVWHTAFLIRDKTSKKILGTGSITRDMTYRKALEDELRLSEAKSSGIISISSDAIISIDQDQNIILFNEGAEKIFGYSKKEMMGQKLDLLIPERFHIGERGSTIYGRRKNGEEFPADAAISKIDVGGSQIMTVTLRDITDRVRIEKAQLFLSEVSAALAEGLILESTLQRLAELVVKNLSDFCILEIACDNDEESLLKIVSKKVTQENKCEDCIKLAELVKSSPSAFSQLILKSRHPFMIEQIREEHLTLLSSSEVQLQTLKHLHFNSLLSVPMMAHNKFIGTLVLVSTSPERQYHDNDLRLAEELASRAALSIENSHLYNQAKNAIATREDILAVVSHDLKNPLTAIKLIGQTLQLLEAPDKATCDRLAAKIESSARQMQVLIGDLLDFAKIESGTFAVAQKSERLLDAVRETVESMQVQAEAKQQSLINNLSKDLPRVNIDLPRIAQVVSNLVGNALKFTPAGGRISISAKPRKFDVLVSVSDTGTGIPAENLAKIFDRFWQAEATKNKGSGLGLSIAKGIVQAHGGKIWAESQVGVGTTIHFTLPLATKASIESDNAMSKSSPSEPLDLSQPVLKGAKILVVDDSPDNLFLIKHLLESMGAEVTVAESVKSALSNIKFSMPHILFTDIEMPEETGYDLLSQLRHSTDVKNKTLPVIALTAHSHDQEMSRIKKAGFDFYLSKPINIEKMISAILQFAKH